MIFEMQQTSEKANPQNIIFNLEIFFFFFAFDITIEMNGAELNVVRNGKFNIKKCI